MSPAPPELANCPHCGAPNPVGVAVCGYCGGRIAIPQLEPPTIGVPPPDNFELVTSTTPPSPIAVALLIVGILLIIMGIGLLALAPGVHQSVQSFNNGCSMTPDCQPQYDPSGAMTAGGVAAVFFGIILAGVGVYLRSN